MKTSIDQATVLEFVARVPQMARELGRPNVEMLLDGASVQEVAAGRTFIRDRMPVDFIYFVLDGTLDVHIEQDGKSRKIATVKPGEWMGEISVLSGELLASATIITHTTCKLLRVHHITFGNLITENQTVAKVLLEHFIALMAQRFRAPIEQQ
jgi:CRP-like cAMP-binding protein